jgi:hypothetical protein
MSVQSLVGEQTIFIQLCVKALGKKNSVMKHCLLVQDIEFAIHDIDTDLCYVRFLTQLL